VESPRTFDPRQAWEERLGERYDLDGVGFDGLGKAYNRWMYLLRREVFARVTREHLREPGIVLDAGTGTGFYIDCWRDLPAGSIWGSDITQLAVDNLRARYPDHTFERWEMGDGDPPFPDEFFDAISAMDVLFHIVDDRKYRQAFRDLGRMLKPEGLLIFSDNFRRGPAIRRTHIVDRPAEEIDRCLEEAGFRFVTRQPMFVLMNAPVNSPFLRLAWSGLAHAVGRRETIGAAIGRALFPLERRLVRAVENGPSTEIAVYRRGPTSRPSS